MQFFSGKSPNTLIWGFGVLILLIVITIPNIINKPKPLDDTLRLLDKKTELVTQIRVDLSKSVEMEKTAVIAVTDEESQEFANQSRVASAAVEQELKQLGLLIDTSPHQDEKALFIEFNTSWADLQKIDQVILNLAVQNTNLKASSLSRGKGFEAMQRYVNALNDVLKSYSGVSNEGEIARFICYAISSGQKIFIIVRITLSVLR